MKSFKHFSKTAGWIIAMGLSVLLAACGSSGGGTVQGPAAPGSLGVSLTDAPACGFDAVNVTVVKVRVHQSQSATDSDAGWTDIALNPARKINLLDLTNGVLENLGETPISAGHYTQLRLVLDANTAGGMNNSVVPTGGAETPLVTPSAVQSGIKLINEFDVASDQRVDLVLDFDACKSVVARGNGTYALKPVIKIVPTVLNGIEGYVDTALLGSNVMVTAQQQGVIVRSTVPNAQTGAFFLGRLEPSNYDVVLTANAHTTTVIGAVPVASSTSVTTVSSNAAPIALPTSATHKISGHATLNPVDAGTTAYATAKQALGAGTIVSVGYTAADDTTTPPGAYSLTLPIAAPLLGQYSATLPISYAAQASVAGQYTVEASASGYQSQTSALQNISTADMTLDFVLIP